MQSINKQSGVVLVMVLVSVTVIMITVATLSFQHQLEIKRASRQLISEQAFLLGLSSENWWKTRLVEDRETSIIDDLSETWSFPSPALPVQGGTMSSCMIDLQSRININNLANYPVQLLSKELQHSINAGSAELIRRAIVVLGRVDGFSSIAVVHDWIDSDSNTNYSNGAEDVEYLQEEPPRMAANRPLVNLHELALLKNFNDVDIAAWSHLFTALPKATQINVNTASIDVLSILIDSLNRDVVSLLIERRPYLDAQTFMQSLVDVGAEESILLANKSLIDVSNISVRSEFFQLNTIIELGPAHFVLRSLIHRPTTGRAKILQRTLTSLPSLKSSEGLQLLNKDLCPSRDFVSA